jgi:hypothetical protein
MDTDKPGKTRTPRRDGRPGSGLLIRPHVGAETRVKSGGRAERATVTDESVLSDTSDDARSGQASDAPRDANR